MMRSYPLASAGPLTEVSHQIAAAPFQASAQVPSSSSSLSSACLTTSSMRTTTATRTIHTTIAQPLSSRPTTAQSSSSVSYLTTSSYSDTDGQPFLGDESGLCKIRPDLAMTNDTKTDDSNDDDDDNDQHDDSYDMSRPLHQQGEYDSRDHLTDGYSPFADDSSDAEVYADMPSYIWTGIFAQASTLASSLASDNDLQALLHDHTLHDHSVSSSADAYESTLSDETDATFDDDDGSRQHLTSPPFRTLPPCTCMDITLSLDDEHLHSSGSEVNLTMPSCSGDLELLLHDTADIIEKIFDEKPPSSGHWFLKNGQWVFDAHLVSYPGQDCIIRREHCRGLSQLRW